MSKPVDLLVIGAGPAGLACATTAAKLGLSVTLIDEQPAPGGQIHRGIESRTVQASSVSYADDARGAALVVEFRSCGAQYLSGTQVWQMEPDRKVYITDGTRTFCMQGKRVLIAVGAMERPVPIPGWTLPGVMTVGAAQIRYKTTGWLPPNGTNGTWLAGSGPLLWLYAAQVIEAGGCVAGILDTTPKSNYTQALRYAAGALRNHGYLIRGRALQNTVRKAGVRVVQGVSALEAQGEGQVRDRKSVV